MGESLGIPGSRHGSGSTLTLGKGIWGRGPDSGWFERPHLMVTRSFIACIHVSFHVCSDQSPPQDGLRAQVSALT